MIFVSSFLAVQASFWPVLLSLAIFSSLANIVLFISGKISFIVVLAAFKFLCLVSFLWWKDFMRESIVGFHTHKLEICLRSSMLLFILSEVFFFISFFWAFYDASLSPVVELGLI
jgi:cytochrome c oxidase subunit 3